MRFPAVALAWEFWRRHRLGLGAVIAVVAVGAAASPLTANAALAHSIWFAIGLLYVLGVFAHGFEARMEGTESGFPPRLLLLPVRTSVLVGWPMVQSAVLTAGLWIAWDRLVLRPSGNETPMWWAALIAAVAVTGQALMWLPFGLPWLRVVVACAVLTALSRLSAIVDGLAPKLGELGAWAAAPANRDTARFVLALAVIPVAFLVARAGVARARRGDSPDWLRGWRSAARPAAQSVAARPFASAVRAQAWYEWRLRGRGFVVTVTAVVLALAGLALFAQAEVRADYALVFLFVPPLIAGLWGSQMGSTGESIRSAALTAFGATRPLSDAELAEAKRRAAGRAALAAWVVVLGLAALWLIANNGYERMSLLWEGAERRYGREQTIGLCVLWAVGLTFATWRGLSANLWVGLCGRTWMVPAHTIAVVMIALEALMWWGWVEMDADRRARLLGLLAWAVGAALVGKGLLAGWALRTSVRRGLRDRRDALRELAVWLAVAGGLFGVLAGFGSHLGPWYRLAVAAVLLVPLARPAVAPLALAWNRHR